MVIVSSCILAHHSIQRGTVSCEGAEQHDQAEEEGEGCQWLLQQVELLVMLLSLALQGKWTVPLPKVKAVGENEVFKVIRSGKRKSESALLPRPLEWCGVLSQRRHGRGW